MAKLLEMGEESELDLLRRRVEDLEVELEQERAKVSEARAQFSGNARALARLRSQLAPWYNALRGVFGELDAVGVEQEQGSTPAASSNQPQSAAAWTAWKQQLPPSCGRVIDALLVQPLSAGQLKTICRLGTSTVSEALAILKRNNLTEKDGSLVRLRRI